MQIAAIVIGVAIIAVIAVSIVLSVVNKNAVLKNPYVTVGEHKITKLEYDYYYNSTVYNYVNTYSSILGYMGLDTTKDFSEQQFTDNLTWKDNFDQMTVQQIQRTKAIADDAKANNFVYDVTEDYKTALASINTGAETAGITVADYYKSNYGSYANEQNTEPFVKEALLVSAYYDEMLANNVPAEDEIKDYYTEHTQEYDKVDYRSFQLKADVASDAADKEKAKAMAEVKEKADAMAAARKEGADFRELCVENAAEADKATYENTETDASLNEGKYFSGISGVISGWLYEEGRADKDITVIEDETNNQYYVVEFISRYYDEADDETISDTLANNSVSDYIEGLLEKYTIIDNKGDLKYLTVDTSTADTETTEEEEGTAEETEDTTVPVE